MIPDFDQQGQGPNRGVGPGSNCTSNTFGECIQELRENLRFVERYVGLKRRRYGRFRNEWSWEIYFV